MFGKSWETRTHAQLLITNHCNNSPLSISTSSFVSGMPFILENTSPVYFWYQLHSRIWTSRREESKGRYNSPPPFHCSVPKITRDVKLSFCCSSVTFSVFASFNHSSKAAHLKIKSWSPSLLSECSGWHVLSAGWWFTEVGRWQQSQRRKPITLPLLWHHHKLG